MKEQAGKRRISPKARERMISVGTSNLLGWREKTNTRAIALEAEVNAFREKLLTECGSNRSATRLALVEACAVTYASIKRLEHSIVYGPKKKLMDVTERVSWLTSNLARLLKQLNIDAKPRPRCLADLVEQKPSEAAPKSTV